MLKRIKWKDYRLLNQLELNFSKNDGTAYNTIILAGENGTGKTTILDTLAAFLNKSSILPFEYIEYSIDGTNYRIIPSEQYAGLGFHKRIDLSNETEEMVNRGKSNNENKISEDLKDIRSYGFVYSKARSGFNTSIVKSSTTMQIDSEKYEPDELDDFTRIKQLLIDIDGQDSSAWMKRSADGDLNDFKFEEFKKKSKGYRFENAFNEFFENVEYKGIDNNNPNEKRVLFKKHGKEILVDQLSTGEKQIVFRGAHLLKNSRIIEGGIIFIDEPELSMHPVWQRKILDYYRGLFNNDGKQCVQMIFATHSEHIIQSALKDRDNVLVIVLFDDNGIVKCKHITAPSVLPSITSAETNYLAFGIPTIDYHIELYGYLQSKTNNYKIVACDEYIARHPLYNATKHEKIDSYQGTQFRTLPTYIRNAIDHPDSRRKYTEDEFKESINLLIELCRSEIE